ncbi:MAG: hypothetical protein ABIT08_15445 [Bacteroidia bacterium]
MESTRPYQDGMKIRQKPLNFELLKMFSAKGIKIKPSLLKHCKQLSVFLSLFFICIGVHAQTELKSFTANFTGSKTKLSWELKGENNINYFSIERSPDGKMFETIGLVKATGNQQTQSGYSFFDKDYYDHVIYYRLKSLSNEGKEKALAGIIAVQIKDEIKEAAIYPQPYIPNMVYVDVSKINNDKIIVDATDADGQKLTNNKLDKSQNEIAVALKSSFTIQKGEYTLTAFYDNHIVKTRLSIKDSSLNFSEVNNPPGKIQLFTLK